MTAWDFVDVTAAVFLAVSMTVYVPALAKVWLGLVDVKLATGLGVGGALDTVTEAVLVLVPKASDTVSVTV